MKMKHSQRVLIKLARVDLKMQAQCRKVCFVPFFMSFSLFFFFLLHFFLTLEKIVVIL